MIKVCWISNIPSPYKVSLMNLLSSEIEIYALFEEKKASDREKNWHNYNFDNYKVEFLDSDYKKTIKKYVSKCDLLINADYTNKICMYATKEFKKVKKPVVLQADGGLVVKRGLFDKVISYFMKQCDYFLSSGKEVNKYFHYYGINDDKIYNYKFSSLTNEDIVKNRKLINNKTDLKKENNINHEIVIFSVGQQIPRKGYDILVRAMKNIDKNIALYIAGGSPEKKVTDIIKENNLDNIYFIGFKDKETLKKYYACADIFVLPTRYDIWGLVINEAMSFGLPIISSDKCVAAMEFNNLFNNAIIYENENSEKLSNVINMLINNKSLRLKLGENSLMGIQEYTIENTRDDFLKIINDIVRKHYGEN